MSAKRWFWMVGLVAALGLWACDDDEPGDTTGDTGLDVAPVEGCDVVLSPSEDAYPVVQAAFQDTPADSAICFQPGTYGFSEELSITTRGITLRGVGEGVVFDFSNQSAANGMVVTGNDFTIEDLALLNMPGDGIVVTGAENVVFRNLRVSWDGEPRAENGAYAIYPVQSTNVLVEDCEVTGASDAGIYVGQSQNIIVRNNDVHGNVAGIEIENSTHAEVYGNHTYDNSAGILVFNIPDLPVHTGGTTRVYDNIVEDNNRPNFAAEGTTIAGVPTGLGIMVWAADVVEVDLNTISGNDTAALVVVSTWTANGFIQERPEDLEHDPYPETVYIHDNTYTGNGQDPQDDVAELIGVETFEDIVWDGAVDSAKPNEDRALDLCIQEAETVTFRNFNILGAGENQTTDISVHDCTHDPVPPVELPPAN